jgi:hypothetical protein
MIYSAAGPAILRLQMFPSELRAFQAVVQSGSIRKASELLDARADG